MTLKIRIAGIEDPSQSPNKAFSGSTVVVTFEIHHQAEDVRDLLSIRLKRSDDPSNYIRFALHRLSVRFTELAEETKGWIIPD